MGCEGYVDIKKVIGGHEHIDWPKEVSPFFTITEPSYLIWIRVGSFGPFPSFSLGPSIFRKLYDRKNSVTKIVCPDPKVGGLFIVTEKEYLRLKEICPEYEYDTIKEDLKIIDSGVYVITQYTEHGVANPKIYFAEDKIDIRKFTFEQFWNHKEVWT